jgi:glycosyltransferase involved in cell wall biosynthesis
MRVRSSRSVALPPGLPEPEPDTLIYPGALSYDANLDAMRYFLREIFPRIRAARPGVRLRITGKTTPEQRAALPSTEGVELTGYVHDIRAAVAGAWAEVVPLRAGGGTRLKVLEALAIGTPVVSTSKGAEGLDLAAGEDLLIADTPEQFAQATLKLLGDPMLRERLAARGRATVQARYDWRTIAGQLTDLVEQVVVARGEREHEPASA